MQIEKIYILTQLKSCNFIFYCFEHFTVKIRGTNIMNTYTYCLDLIIVSILPHSLIYDFLLSIFDRGYHAVTS